ncbi:MAG: hypothetical protein ACR2KV_03620 [Solirubrobacteraceae bacterium]
METVALTSPRLPGLVAAGAGATILAGLIARIAGAPLGTPLAPFMARLDPRAVAAAPLVVLAVAAAALAAPRLLERPTRPGAFGLAALGLTLGLRLALAAARGGIGQWDAVFGGSAEAPHEYLPALPALHIGVHAFLERFAEIAPTLPIHPSGHPPGMLLALHLLGIHTPAAMAALTIGVGALSVPLTYRLARCLGGERRARTATLLVAFSPSVLIIGVSSADALYATLGLAAAVGLSADRAWLRAVGALLLAVASFFSFALLAVGVWAVLVRAVRGEVGAAARLALVCAAAVVAFYLALRLATGFDVLATLHALNGDYRRGIAGVRAYEYWLFGSPTAFLVALGIPVAWLATRALARLEPAATALAAVIVAASVLGYTKAENERIWVFLVPFACLAAASELATIRLRSVLAALAAQAALTALLLDTIW